MKLRVLLASGLLILVSIQFAASQSSGITRVWAVDDGERIKKTVLNHPLATSSNNKVWNGSSISLFGSRNEVVAFQLMIQGNSTGATSVNVKLDSLYKSVPPQYSIKNSGVAGDPFDYTGKKIEMFVEHYMNITARSAASFLWWSGARPLPDADFTGLIPEQLVPFEASSGSKTNGQGGAPFSVTANQNQGVWIDVYIPRDAQPGDYSGTLKVTEGSVLRYSIPVNLKVYNFMLSDTTHIYNMFHIDSPGITARHGVSKWSSQYWSLMKKYYAMGHRHRADVTDGRLTLSNLTSNLGGMYTGSYYSSANKYGGPGEGVGNRTYSIGTYDQPRTSSGTDRGSTSGFTYNADTNVFRATWQSVSNQWVDWFSANAPGTRIHKYMADEPGVVDTTAFSDIRRKARWLKTNPGSGRLLKTLCTTNIRPDLRGSIDMWMTTTQSGYINGGVNPYPAGYVIDSANAARARGEFVGMYNGCSPSFGTQAIDGPATHMRVDPWIMWKYGVDLYYLWYINHYGDESGNPIDPWAGDRRNSIWGDGSLIYAGENKGSNLGNDRGLQGPIAGIRLKNWRRGAQDYEYLYLARQLGLEVSQIVDSVVVKAFDQVTQNAQARYSSRGYKYEIARHQIAELITSTEPSFPTGTFAATPDSLPANGGNVTLTWTSSLATSATIDNGVGPVPTNGTVIVPLTSSQVFHLTLANSAGSQVLSAPVTVAGVQPPPNGTLIISPDTLPVGGGLATLIWVSSNAVSGSFDQGIGNVPANGTLPVNIDSTRTFRLTLTSPAGSANIEKTVVVRTPPPIPTGTFFATPDSLPVGGGNVTLFWVSTNATGASIDNGVGDVSVSGSLEVFVPNPRTFALTLSNQTGSRVLTVPIRVTGTPPPPNGTFSVSPDSLTPGGGNVTLNWTSLNATSASLDNGIGPVLLNGSLTVAVNSSRIFRLNLTNATSTQELVVHVHVEGTSQPPSGTFIASPDSLPPGGGNVTLVWVSYDATSAAIDNGIGNVPLNGSQTVFVTTPKTFALTLSNSAGSNVLSTAVRVGTAAPTPSGSFSASPDTLQSSGGYVTLVWTSQNATSATIDNGIGFVTLDGSLSVPVAGSTVFHLSLSNPSGTYELAVPVVVRGVTQPPTGTFVVTPDSLPADGGEVTLIWVSSNAATASLDNGIGSVAVNGSLTLLVSTSRTFVLTLGNAAGGQVLSASVRVAGTPPRPSGTFSASPDTLPPGGRNVTLSWASQNATSASIDNGVGPVPLNGSIAVVVSASTIFRLTLSSATGTQEFIVPVFVQAATQPPTGTFIATPDSLPVGGGNVTLVWFSSNATSALLDHGIGSVPVSGLETVFVADTRTYALTLSNAAGSRVFTASVRVVGAAPTPTGTLSASPETLPPGGGNVRLVWTSFNTTNASIDNGIGSVALNGSLTIPVSGSTVFRLNLSNATSSYEISVPVVVQTSAEVPTGTFVATPDTLPPGGGNATLVWATSNALSAAIDNGIGSVPLSGSQSVGITASKNFRLSLSNAGGTAALTAPVIVAGTAPAPTATLIATPDTLPVNGGPVTLIWVSSNATSVSLDGGIGNVPPNGSLTVNITSTKTLRLTVSNSSGSFVTSVRIRVATPDHLPAGTFIAIPDSLPPGGGTVRLMWISTNSSGATINNGIGPVNLTGYRIVYVPESIVYSLTLSNSVSSLMLPVSVRVGQAPPPVPNGSFSSNPASLPPGGGEVSLVWNSSGADSAWIDQGVGNVPLNGSRTVTVGVSQTFTLRLKNAGGNTLLTSNVSVELPNAGPQDITIQGIPNVFIPLPTGNGNPNIEVIRDGVTPPVGTSNPLEQYDTYTGEVRSFDWVGYQFESPQTFNNIMFQEGMQFPTGGWFDSVRVQVRVGAQWVDVQDLSSTPEYGRNNGIQYEMHDLTFAPAIGDAIRVAGRPGGTATFVSVAELRVLRLNEPLGNPRISIIAVPDSVPVGGGEVTLHWSVANAQSAQINGNVGAVAMSGSTVVNVTGPARYELTALNINGTQTTGVNVRVGHPLEYALNQNFPNPFNPSTQIRFTVKGQNDVSLTIYNILGQRVRTVFEGKMDEGAKTVEWDGRDDLGRPQSTGTYIYRLKADRYVSARKMLLLK